MFLKDGVSVRGLQAEILLAILIVNEVCKSHGIEPTITSITDGKHSDTSYHYQGDAVDFRTKDILPAIIPILIDQIRLRLTPEYDVLHESEGTPNQHLHIEFNRRRK
jgi:hypothetical protein